MAKMDEATPQIRHTAGHKDCPACARATEMQVDSPLTPELTFREAFQLWIKTQVLDNQGQMTDARYISDRTQQDLRQYARAAGKFFDNLRLDEIHVGHLREYHRARAVCDKSCGAWQKPAGANLIRHEVAVVVRVMKAASAWKEDHHEKFFQPLATVEADVPRAMTPDEQHRWLHVAASRTEWRTIYWYSIVALQTTAATNEMRSLRIGDVFLDQGVLQIRNEGAKNKFRVRTIPFGDPQILWALNGLLERAKRLGARSPHHYLFPKHRGNSKYDVTKPMTVWGFRKPWEACREAAGMPWLTPYELRHTAITRMAEAGVPIQVIMSMAGHISPRMQQHYTTISMQAKRRWMAAAWAGGDMGQAAMGQGMGAGMGMMAPAAMPPIRPSVMAPSAAPFQAAQVVPISAVPVSPIPPSIAASMVAAEVSAASHQPDPQAAMFRQLIQDTIREVLSQSGGHCQSAPAGADAGGAWPVRAVG
jgi:integrase